MTKNGDFFHFNQTAIIELNILNLLGNVNTVYM